MNNKTTDLEYLRHSTAHLLAAAVMEIWPKTKRTIGPSIEDGFYFDFDFGDLKISENDLPEIEAKMHEIVKGWKSFDKHELSKEEAKSEYPDNEYKHELIEEFSNGGKKKISFYKSGTYWDLCLGGHIDEPSKYLKYFKLLTIAGAYWHGDEKNKMLTRIYGTAFFSQKELDEYLAQIDEAKKRDHRKLGKLLDLYTFSDLVGAGLPLYTPKGAILRKLINEYVEELQSKEGSQQVWTNQFARAELFKISGHYDKYKDSMFHVSSNYTEEEFYLKPMNCPQHTQIYASQARSYKDLPIRYTDFAMLYRDEKPGELSGLARVRSFSQDDCHIFCREDQVDEEIDKMLNMTKKVMLTFGFKYKYRLSTRDVDHPEKYLGDPKTWDKVEKWAVTIIKRNKIEYIDGPGEAAFYAPKMDLIATDALGREWQLSTVQIDYVMPQRFNLEYTDKDGSKKHPIMLHRAILGSSERFLSVILEHFAGNFPVWLTPVQVKVLPITDKQLAYAKDITEKLKNEKIRVELDDRSETLGAKIRDAQNEKVSYMLIVGEKEEKSLSLSIRTRSGENKSGLKIEKFIEDIKKEIEEKLIN